MRLWVEHAHGSLVGESIVRAAGVGDRAVSTFQTEEQFWAMLVTCPQAGAEAGARARQIAGQAAALLEQGTALEAAAETLLGSFRQGEHSPTAILHVRGEDQAALVECDAPPLFLVRHGQLVLLPVLEDDVQGRLVRHCQFSLQDGDHLAIVSEEYVRARGWNRRWGWRDIALAIRRWTDTGCDAEQLLAALLRMYGRLAQGEPAPTVTVLAMHVRPVRSVTLWSGPPADPAQDAAAVERFMAEPGRRVICGDTTAAIAARVLGRPLEQEPRPEEGWAEVPPTSRLPGVDLVTEGVVTLRQVCDRLAGGRGVKDLRAGDGATRLARLLLAADVVRFLAGGAVNPAQRDGAVSWRQKAIERLVSEVRSRGKVVTVEWVDVKREGVKGEDSEV